MAISKTQNERPAIIDLIDATNDLETANDENAANIATNTSNIDTNARHIATLSANQTALSIAVGEIIDDVSYLESFQDKFRIGITTTITVPASDSETGSIEFDEPFDSLASCIVFAQVVTAEPLSNFTVAITETSYDGFSYEIANNDTDPQDVKLGYMAINVIGLL